NQGRTGAAGPPPDRSPTEPSASTTPTGKPSAPSTAATADRSCETSSPPTSAAPAPNRPESPAPRKSPRPTPRPGLDRPRRRKRRPGLRAPRVGKGSLLRKEPKKRGKSTSSPPIPFSQAMA